MNNIDILIENIDSPPWIDNVQGFLLILLKKLEIDNWEFSVTLCDDNYISMLNKEYRNKNNATDVLTFAQDDEPLPFNNENMLHNVGDIIISLHTLIENVEYFGVGEEEELKRLLVHGVLHLYGMDHEDNSPDQDMLRFQEKILTEMTEVKIF